MMTPSEWLDLDEKRIKIDGRAYTLDVTTYIAIYPYRHEALYVSAVPVNKSSQFYLTRKAEMGDDWVTDVLANPELTVDVLRQLGAGPFAIQEEGIV